VPATLSEKGQQLIKDDLPAYYHEDPHSIAVVDAGARELQRIEDAAQEFRLGLLPHTATGAYLRVWERTFALPVEPDGATEEQRRAKVMAHFRKRYVVAGRDWIALVSTALGTTLWDHVEISPYTLLIVLPYGEATWTAQTALELVREVTPANLAINVTFDNGFIVGYSQIGIDPL
jgi:hypothetical protein